MSPSLTLLQIPSGHRTKTAPFALLTHKTIVRTLVHTATLDRHRKTWATTTPAAIIAETVVAIIIEETPLILWVVDIVVEGEDISRHLQ